LRTRRFEREDREKKIERERERERERETERETGKIYVHKRGWKIEIV